MLQDFGTWAAPLSEYTKFDEFAGSTIAIEASWFLDLHLTQPPYKEPLLSALGGLPFALKSHVEATLDALIECQITPLFVFHGLSTDYGLKLFEHGSEVAQKLNEAWELYNSGQAESAVEAFGASGYSQAENYYRLLQLVLKEKQIKFLVAPYRAWAQLSYLYSLGNQYIDAVAGSSELLLYPLDKIITGMDREAREFTFFRREAALHEMGGSDYDSFIDAAILSGTSMTPTLPLLRDPNRTDKLRQAYNMMKSSGSSGLGVCINSHEDPAMQRMDYLDRFKKSRLSVKHSVYLQDDGSLVCSDAENMPNDSHEFLGPRFPEELYYYLSIGLLSARSLNRLSQLKVLETQPPDGGESPVYRELVQSKLVPLQLTGLAMVAKALARFLHYQEMKVICWFEPDQETSAKLIDILPSLAPVTAKWNVSDDALAQKHRLSTSAPTVSAMVQALNDPSFASKTQTPRDTSRLLATLNGVFVNTFWRFLHLRQYLNDEHGLTSWGNVLDTILANLAPESGLEEAAFMVTELLRYGLLTAQDQSPAYNGLPAGGSATDKRHTMLLARIGCLCELKHKDIGFTGPLSRNLLAFTSAVNAIRSADRDLLEATLTNLVLGGDADRAKLGDGLQALSLSLPFLLPLDCGMGIAIKSYLDELSSDKSPGTGPTDPVRREAVKALAEKSFFPYSVDFAKSLDRVASLWDAAYAGVKVAGQLGLVKDVAIWDQADEWFQHRR